MTNEDQLKKIENQRTSIKSLIQLVVSKKGFLNLARISEVYNENYIKVKLYNGNEVDAVRLLHIGTDKCRIVIQPKIGDNVMVFTTQIYVEETDVDINAEVSEVLSSPYSNATMNAILISPESDENMLTNITVDEDGNVSLKSQGEIYAAVTDDNWEEQESVTIGLDSITLKDVKNDNTIVLDKDGMSAQNGHSGVFDVGNSIDTLGKLIDAFIDEIINLKTYGSPYSHSTDPSSVVKLKLLKEKWAKVFKV